MALDKITASFNNIRSFIMGSPSNQALDQIDDILNNISNNILDHDPKNYAEMLRTQFFNNINTDTFKDLNQQILMTPDQSWRLLRYQYTDEIVDTITYCSRALMVLRDEIVAPDKITKKMIQIDCLPGFNNDDVAVSNIMMAIRDITDVEEQISNIVQDAVQYGDSFVEICDYKSTDVPITQSLLVENEHGKYVLENENYSDNDIIEIELPKTTGLGIIEDDNTSTENKMKKISIVTELIGSSEEVPNNSDEKVQVYEIKLIRHDPRLVIKLQSPKFRVCLGYLVMPQSISIASGTGATTTPVSPSVQTNQAYLQTLMHSANGANIAYGIDKIYIDILSKLKRKLGNNEIQIDKQEVKELIYRFLKDVDDQARQKFQVRYVPVERMVHFKTGGDKYFPYGDGIFNSIQNAAKKLAILETALAVKRATDATDRRVIYVEHTMPRQLRNQIEDIRTHMNKRTYAAGAKGGVGSVPTMITSFENFYIPTYQGKRFVEFETMPPSVNIRDLSDEIKSFKDSLISGLPVPPAYIGSEEALSNKNVLSHESIIFARTIVAYQTRLTAPLRELFVKIFKIMYPTTIVSPKVLITFSPPRSLEIELDNQYITNVGSIIAQLRESGIPTEFLIKKFLGSWFNWAEIEQYKTQSDIETKAGAKPEGDPSTTDQDYYGA